MKIVKQVTTKTYTIKELMNKLREAVETNPKVTPNTKVVLSDFNMSGFKEDLMVEPVRLVGKEVICLFHSLESTCQDKESVVK